jgi:hypothetical protein
MQLRRYAILGPTRTNLLQSRGYSRLRARHWPGGQMVLASLVIMATLQCASSIGGPTEVPLRWQLLTRSRLHTRPRTIARSYRDWTRGRLWRGGHGLGVVPLRVIVVVGCISPSLLLLAAASNVLPAEEAALSSRSETRLRRGQRILQIVL